MHKPQYRKPVRSLHALGLADDTADVNAHRQGDETALIWAADYGTPAVLKALLARGARVNAKDRHGCTALHYAAWNGREKNTRLLLAASAKVDCREGDGHTPLMGAHNVKIARQLLRHGADVNARSQDGWTPLLDAVLSGSPELAAFFLANKANIHARNSEGKTPLLLHTGLLNDFSHAEDTEITGILLQGGAQVNEPDNEGEKSLWKAVMRLRYGLKALDTIRLLLRAGAIADDEAGAKLLAWTRRNGYTAAVALLAASGAKE